MLRAMTDSFGANGNPLSTPLPPIVTPRTFIVRRTTPTPHTATGPWVSLRAPLFPKKEVELASYSGDTEDGRQ